MRYEGLENDVTYMRYVEMRDRVINTLMDDDTELDPQYLSILIQILKNTRNTLDEIKEYRDGREE